MEDEVEYEKRRNKRFRKRCLVGILIIVILLLILIIGLVLGFYVVPLLTSKVQRDFRLPVTVKPDIYKLYIQPNLVVDNFTFDGNVSIQVLCLTSTKEVILHSKDLKIRDVKIADRDRDLKITKREVDLDNDFLIINLKNKLKVSATYEISISFSGKLSDNYRGFFWSSYEDGEEQKYFAATYFKPTFARRAFPCFDEPSFKATFEITILRRKNQITLSNTEKKASHPREDDWVADEYANTKIPTYMVAFFIGNFRKRPGGKESDTEISLWTREESVNKGKFALGVARDLYKIIAKTKGFYSKPKKIDILAIPGDLDDVWYNGKAENFGLIMMDEHNLLYEDNDDEYIKQNITANIANQLVRQWLGNIITAKWWSDEWLIDAIATYLEIVTVDELFPDWKWSEKFIIRQNLYSEEDCSESSQPLSINVDKPDKIFEALNSGNRYKGARLIRMVHSLLEDNFWKRFAKFMGDAFHNSTTQRDFWNSLMEAQSDNQEKLDLETIASSWINNKGHPFITLTRNYHNKSAATLNQVSCTTESSKLWKIPITYIDSRDAKKLEIKTWLNSANSTLYNLPESHHWVQINSDQLALSNVNYDSQNWEMLAAEMKDNHEIIQPVSRYQLIYDAYTFAQKNMTSYEYFLDLLLYLRKENEPYIWEILSVVKLSEIGKMVRRDAKQKWEAYVRHVTEPLYRKIDWKQKISETRKGKYELSRDITREEIVMGACFGNEILCKNEALKKYDDWITKKEKASDPSLMKIYLCTAIRNDDQMKDSKPHYSNTKKYYEENNGTVFAEELVYALGCVEHDNLLFEYVSKYLINGKVDPAAIFDSFLNNKLWDKLFSDLRTLWLDLLPKLPRLKLIIQRLCEAVANPTELKTLEAFIDEKKGELEDKKIRYKELLENARQRISSIDHHRESIVKWLELEQWKKKVHTRKKKRTPNIHVNKKCTNFISCMLRYSL